MSNREKESTSHPDIWDGKRPLNLDIDPNWSNEQLELSLPNSPQVADEQAVALEGSLESWFGARRVPLTLALTIIMALGLVSLPHWGTLGSSISNMVDMMDSEHSPVSMQAINDLGKAGRALSAGVDAANKIAQSTPGWAERLGHGAFEHNRPGIGYALALTLNQRQCENLKSKAWMIDGLSSVQMDAREVWSSKPKELKQCPVGSFDARLIFYGD